MKIRIFSTQRIDKKADLFKCESIVPVRCGAVYDKTDGDGIIGDNTGDNISERRMSFCELTTQYWAWKNVDADYYGFCHYRRYFSFSEYQYDTDAWNNIIDKYIDDDSCEKYEINDEQISSVVQKYDIILPEDIDLTKVGISSVRDQYKTGVFLEPHDLDVMCDIIKDLYPEYLDTAKEYLNANRIIFCNMMIMKKPIFEHYSKWLFDILFEFEKRVDMSARSEEGYRTPGHLGERLLAIYCMFHKQRDNLKLGRLQMVTFASPERTELLMPVFPEENTAHIVLSSSLYFSPFCATTIKSVIDNSSAEHNYDIIVLHTEIPKKVQVQFKKMIDGMDNFSIRFCNVTRIIDKYNLVQREHFSLATYYRLAICDFMPDYKKVVYLDSDLVVMKDIYELYSTDVSNCALAGVTDICLSGINNGYDKDNPTYYEEHAFIKPTHMLEMINAGVLVMNLSFISAKYSAKDLLKYAQEGNFKLCDQDVLNSLFQDDIKHIAFNWNTPDYEDETLTAWCTRFAPRDLVEEYRSAVKTPYILHYSSTIKPWNEPGYQQADIFWSTLRRTPFYELVIHRRIVENASYYSSLAEKKNLRRSKLADGRPFWRRVADKLYPKGTRRREKLKKFVCFITGKKYVAPYYPVK